VNILRRLPLSHLLALCALVVALGASATALASTLISAPKPPSRPLPDAIHDALADPPVSGISAQITFTNHLIDASSLESQGGGESASSPLLTSSSGRLWISDTGQVRLELQSEKGDTQVIYDGQTISIYDAAANTLYRFDVPSSWEQSTSPDHSAPPATAHRTIPTVEEIQNTIAHLMRHANLSGAVPDDVAGQPAYTTRISPSHDGGLIGGAELSWDAVHGVPLRLAVYSSTSSSPVLELAATEISYGPVSSSVFAFSPPAGAKITQIESPTPASSEPNEDHTRGSLRVTGQPAVQAALPFSLDAPTTLAGMARDSVELVHVDHKPAALVTYGQGLGGLAVLENQVPADQTQGEPAPQSLPGELPKVSIGASTATELPTALGTLLSFDRSGVRYTVAGSVTSTVAQAAGRGL
jgi:outer membrane lipoprotein-sorting protein